MSECQLCVVGGGRWGENHIKTLYEMGSLAGIVDLDAKRLAVLSEQYVDVKTFNNLEDALSGKFEGFIVATSAKTHYKLAKKLLKAGQNVLVEKPLALSSKDSEELVSMSKQYGGTLLAGHQLLFHPAVMKIKQIIDTGVIGKLRYISTSRVKLGTVRQTENVIWSFAPHDLSVINYLTGQVPIKTDAFASSFLQAGIFDMANIELTYSNHVKGFISVSWLHPVKEQKITVVGDQAMLTFDDSSRNKELYLHKKKIDMTGECPVSVDGGIEKIDYVYSPPLKNELNYFIELIRSSEKREYGQNGHEVVKLLEKITHDLNIIKS
ncbi:Gfo/Idh/MocA family oxidoreductase [Sinanaerobacter sp. ZZT-01]|uniref:Gfo/Idh/MocA family protein n=1 Tax=Sinanaerobacter sp. ZZT-01 TaxID=3111540 RepID=UPI002D7A29BB|nr:Gfo/Idh/MocA family oxidoreductase [Sinanaerobacter sp. ZZT-01]WRR93011.1 Gfo/Idh/MocA family oxidoreductase [Sinanaerobacter sp. ZZT-01]